MLPNRLRPSGRLRGRKRRPFVLTAQVIVFLTQPPQLALTDSLLVDEAQDLRIAARC